MKIQLYKKKKKKKNAKTIFHTQRIEKRKCERKKKAVSKF